MGGGAGAGGAGSGKSAGMVEEKYEGQWKRDMMHGHGKYYHAEGSVYDGQWEFGKVGHRWPWVDRHTRK